MINEVLFMEMRLLQLFCTKHNLSASAANRIFNENAIWNYLEQCYDTLHMNGDDYILNDVDQIVASKGVIL